MSKNILSINELIGASYYYLKKLFGENVNPGNYNNFAPSVTTEKKEAELSGSQIVDENVILSSNGESVALVKKYELETPWNKGSEGFTKKPVLENKQEKKKEDEEEDFEYDDGGEAWNDYYEDDDNEYEDEDAEEPSIKSPAELPVIPVESVKKEETTSVPVEPAKVEATTTILPVEPAKVEATTTNSPVEQEKVESTTIPPVEPSKVEATTSLPVESAKVEVTPVITIPGKVEGVD